MRCGVAAIARWLTLALALLAPTTSAVFLAQRQVYNDVDVIVVFDTDAVGDVVQMSYAAPTNVSVGRVILVRASPETTAVAKQVVSRTLSSVSVVTQPSGCDGKDDAHALENSNCVSAGVDTESQRQLLLRTWSLPWYGDRSACVAAGGNVRTCLGKPLVVVDGVDALTVRREFSQEDLLFARSVYLEDYAGPHAELPAYVEIDVERPLLVVSTDCALYGDSFSANYRLLATDAYMGFLTQVHTAFQRWDANGALAEMRLLLERDNATNVWDADRFRVVLADAAGTGVQFDFYRRWFFSDWITVRSSIREEIHARWGVPLAMTNANASQPNCTLTLAMQPAPTPLRLLTPETVTILNFWDPDSRFYRKRVGNYHIGERDRNGMLKFAYTPEFQRGGGIALFESQDFPYARFEVHPNINWRDYALDCVAAYPRSSTFNGFGFLGSDGAAYAREFDAGDLCRAPILNPTKVLSDSSPRARELDCAKQSMVLASNRDFCWRPRVFAPVPLDFLPWNWHGHLKLDPKRHGFMRVMPSQFQQACDAYDPARFAPGVLVPLTSSDDDYEIFIQDRLMWWNRAFGDIPYVVCNEANALCTAYWDADTSGIVRVEAWSRTNPAWPICRLHFSQYEAPARFQSWPTETVRLMRDGQATGKPHDGRLTKVRSLPGYGWGGLVATCPVQPDRGIFDNTLNSTERAEIDAMTWWFMTCRKSERGVCRDHRPRACQCRQWYGPPGIFISAVAADKTQQPDCPCCCPAIPTRGGYIRINGVTSWTGDVLVCGGHERGECVANAGVGTGFCRCEPGRVTSPLATAKTEPAWAGESCACPVPRLSLMGTGQDYPAPRREACSGRGSCCPKTPKHIARTSTRQTQSGVGAGGVSLEECFDDDGEAKLGCDCSTTPGWTGDACACRGRTDLAYAFPVLVGTAVSAASLRNRSAVVVLSAPRVVRSVRVRPQRTDINGNKSCTPAEVWVLPSLDAAPTTCAFDGVEWACPDDVFSLAVVVRTTEAAPQCRVEAFDQLSSFIACGGPGHGNPFAQRFWASETTRGPSTFAELNLAPQSVSAAGCAHRYECMCHASYVGAGCAAGTSRVDVDGTAWPCGSTRLPPTGAYVFDQRTALGKCECAAFNYVDPLGKYVDGVSKFTGDACEAAVWVNPAKSQEALVCGGFTHVKPKFRLGWCSFDWDDYRADPLWTPAIRVRGTVQRPYEQVLNESYVAIGSVFWYVPARTTVVVPTLVGTLDVCSHASFVANLSTTFQPGGLVGGLPYAVVPIVEAWNCTADPINYAVTERTCELVTQVWNDTSTFRPCASNYLARNLTCVLNVLAWVRAPSVAPSDVQFPFNVEVDARFVCTNSTSVSFDVAALYESLALGAIDCNNAVHRMADAFLNEIRGGTYVSQCPYPVTLYNNVLGSFFGLFWDQVPNLKFPEDCANQCSEEHLRYLSSLFNDQICVDAAGQTLEMDDRALHAYGLSLINRTYTSLYQDNGTAEFFRVLEVVYQQSSLLDFVLKYYTYPGALIFGMLATDAHATYGVNVPFNPGLDQTPPEPPYRGPAVHDEEFVFNMFSLETVFYGWALLTYGPPYDMAYINGTITNDTRILQYIQEAYDGNFSLSRAITNSGHTRFTVPGLWQALVGNINPAAFTLTFGRDAEMVQIYDGHYGLCATLTGVKANTSHTVSCDSHVWPYNETELVAYVNRSVELASAYFDTHPGDIGAQLRQDIYGSTPINLKLSYIGVLHDYEGFMKVRIVDSSVSYADGVPRPTDSVTYFYVQTFTISNEDERYPVRYSQTRSYLVANGTTYAQTWDFFTDAVVKNHAWPFNSVWASAVAPHVDASRCRAINVSATTDRAFLANFWHSTLAPRRCSRASQCVDFARGSDIPTCLFPDWHVPWRNSDPAVEEYFTGLGDEGGCDCAPNGQKGFFDASVFCRRCTSGWGPETPQQWQEALRFRETYASFGLSATPFPFTDADVPLAVSNPPLCLLPWNNNRVCSGNGAVVSNRTTDAIVVATQTDPHDAAVVNAPACTSLVVTVAGSSARFDAASPVDDVFVSRWDFAGGDDVAQVLGANATDTTLTQMDGAFYVVSTNAATQMVLGSCVRGADDTSDAWTCAASRADTGEWEFLVACVNADVLDADAHVDVDGLAFHFTPGVFWSTVVTTA